MPAVKPIRPEDVPAKKAAAIPDEAIAAFNELIAENMSGRYARVTQADAIDRIVAKFAHQSVRLDQVRARIFAEGWLDVEEIYRAAGWRVEYDKPGFNEDYGAFWTFRAK